MISGVGEVLVGYRIDADVGPLVMVAAGGLCTPRSTATVRCGWRRSISRRRSAMIDEVRGIEILRGYRGRPRGDLEALAQDDRRVVTARRDDDGVAEAEINPLIVRPNGVIAVDALVKLV